MFDLLVKNGKLVTADGIVEADVAVTAGKYAAFLQRGTAAGAEKVIDAGGLYVFPGIIDCHAHMNEPGFEYREDFETGTRAAASAGCTCLIDMPLNNDPPLINKGSFAEKYARVSRRSYVDFALWGGIIGEYDEAGLKKENNLEALAGLHECGVVAFKGFTCPNGPLFPAVSLGEVREALERLKPYGALCGFHCEEFDQIKRREQRLKKVEGRSAREKIADFLEIHDVWTEYSAVQGVLDMCRATGGRVHICHVSHPKVAQLIKEAIAEGLPVTAETCPHYLGFTEELLYEKGAPAKCTPPLRKRESVEKLWDYVLDGTLSCIGSDHSPAADEEKDNVTRDIWSAWGGLNSIQFFLPLMFDLAVHQKKLSPSLLARVMCEQPAKIFGLYGRKGAFVPGFDGDLVLVDPERDWECRQEKLYTKGHVSCFDGMKGKGMVVQTILRGRTVAVDGVYLPETAGYGQYIARR
ncbi:MAG: allantoinase AllB [Lachnospiraceae bacterium]|jgi:allantoinase|nr:allantoinase AllB [Lachnospiraceae bacterium]